MSDADNEREWRFYVHDMIAFAMRATNYTAGMKREAFLADTRTYDATLRNLAQIDEAATHIPESVRRTHSDVPWRKVIATRNRLTHAYLGIDDDTLWSIIQDDLPHLLVNLERLLGSESRA